jgi:hypothetical protein
MKLNIFKLFNLEKLLRNQGMRDKICNIIVDTIRKKMGRADVCQITKEGGKIDILLLNKMEGNMWKAKPETFFDLNLPFKVDFAKIVQSLSGGKSVTIQDIGGFELYFEVDPYGVLLASCIDCETNETVFDGECKALISGFIEKNAAMIAGGAKSLPMPETELETEGEAAEMDDSEQAPYPTNE